MLKHTPHLTIILLLSISLNAQASEGIKTFVECIDPYWRDMENQSEKDEVECVLGKKLVTIAFKTRCGAESRCIEADTARMYSTTSFGYQDCDGGLFSFSVHDTTYLKHIAETRDPVSLGARALELFCDDSGWYAMLSRNHEIVIEKRPYSRDSMTTYRMLGKRNKFNPGFYLRAVTGDTLVFKDGMGSIQFIKSR